MDTPEGQAARDAARRSRERVQGATDAARGRVTHAGDTVRQEWHDTRAAARERVDRVEHRAQELREDAQRRANEVRQQARATMQDVGRKAGAVQETAYRARSAPGKVAREMGSAVKDSAGNYGKWAAGLGIAGVILLDALVVLTIWLVAAMSSLVGFVIGTFLAGLILVAVAAGAFIWGRSAKKDASHRMNEGMEHSRHIVREVPEPVRREFGGTT